MNVNTEVSFQKNSCTFDKYKAQIDVSDSWRFLFFNTKLF
jgi:hypothetical protein